METAGLTVAQRRAVDAVAAVATGGPGDPAVRVTVHFHPDRLAGGEPILRVMARDGRYRSQFETGTSNGGLTAHPGGDRWRWESRIFAGAYDACPPAERPKYGSLNFRRSRCGGSPRFGSAHLRLAAHVLPRITCCYPDSFLEPEHFGVAGKLSTLLDLATQARDVDPLDDYIEAHVHGPIVFARDVEALVLDPCYRGTATESDAAALGCPVEWHDGYRLSTDELRRHPDFRGPEPVRLSLAIARDGSLDPGIIGDAARTGRHDEQVLKRVWHLVARFGA